MPYSESLANRVRQNFHGRRDVVEKKMFGGVVFMLRGNLCVGIWQTALIARLGPDQAAAALSQPHVGQFDITGRPMKGWVLIQADGLDLDVDLAAWISQAEEFVGTLPAK